MRGANDVDRDPSFADLGRLLRRVDARLEAREVHALYLGAQTSTSFELGPQHLLGHIFGEQRVLGDTPADAKRNVGVLFGYWNTILKERRRGRVALAPAPLRARPTPRQLIEHARRRQQELVWFMRGLDAGGTRPSELGAEGEHLLGGLAKGSAHLEGLAGLLDREPPRDAQEAEETRQMLLGMDATMGTIIANLMELSDEIRKKAMR
jgi:hypothetical protein